MPDLFTLSYEQTVRLLFEDQAVADRMLAIPDTPELAAQRLKGQVTLARVAWNPYLYSPKLMQRLRRIQAPTLIVWGERDRLFPVAMGEAWAAAIAGARLAVVPGSGHMLPVEQPAHTAELVADFVGSHTGQ